MKSPTFQKVVYPAAAVLGAIVLGYVLMSIGVPFFFPNVTYNNSITSTLKVKRLAVPLTMGACSFGGVSKEINTSNPYRSDFLYMPNSNNQKNGVEFSYTFWLKLTSSTLRNSGKVIFTRGIYSNRYDNMLSKGKVLGHERDDLDTLVKCPLVRFGAARAGDTGIALEIMFNTLKEPHNSVRLDEKVFDALRSTKTNPKWTLITLTFRDFERDVKKNRLTNGVELQVFMNDSLVKTHIVENDAIKLNQGDLIITPNRGQDDSESYFSNLTYYNYALGIKDVIDIFNGRASTGACNYPLLSDMGHLGLNMKNQYYRLSLHQQLRQVT